MVQCRDGCPVNPRWPDRRSSCDNWASGSSFSSNKQSQLLRHPLKNLQNKGGNLPSYSLCLFRLEIGNSVSQCYSSSPHDHDSGVQSLQQKKKKKEVKERKWSWATVQGKVLSFEVFRGGLYPGGWGMTQSLPAENLCWFVSSHLCLFIFKHSSFVLVACVWSRRWDLHPCLVFLGKRALYENMWILNWPH